MRIECLELEYAARVLATLGACYAAPLIDGHLSSAYTITFDVES